jgi:Tfp pilus assembly protein PilV
MRTEVTPHTAIVRLRRLLAGERGLSLIEAVMAMALFVGVAAALGGLLTSAISANRVARERTVAEQVVVDQIESIRRLPYSDVGTVSGNPPGTVAATRSINVRGLKGTVTTQVAFVDDPTPTSYATAANYKRVTVVATRSDGKQLARQVTYVAPPTRAPFGGINNAIINVTVVDYALNTPVENANVNLATGPSAPRNDLTDSTGKVTFAALTPNPTSGAQAYYDLTASLSGYSMLADAAATHLQLAPGQTANPTLQIFRPATIVVNLEDAGGNPFTSTATVKVTSARTGATHTFSVSSGTLTITTLGGEPVVPNVSYTVEAFTTGSPSCAATTSSYVPDSYPTDLSTTFTMTLGTCPAGSLDVNVQQSGSPASGATVTVSGGPYSITPVSGTTDASGNVSFSGIPAGSGYTVTATKSTESANTTVSVSDGSTTNASITLPDPPAGNILATVQWAGSPVNGATVTLTGGPGPVSLSGTTDASGQVTFTNLPVGSGYTVAASKFGYSASATASVSNGATTNTTVNLPTGTIQVTTTWAGQAAGSASVSISGGPNGGTYTGTANSSGVASVTVPATSASYPYTVSVSKNGGTGSSSVTSVPSGGTATTTVTLTPTKTITFTVQRGGSNAPNTGVTIGLTGGPNGTAGANPVYSVAGTTNGSAQISITVPAGSGSYTIKIYLTSCSGSTNRSRSGTTVSAASGTTTATVNMTSSTCPLSFP